MRKSILCSFNADIICLGETHLFPNDQDIELTNDYVFRDHRRKSRNWASGRTFGGVCFFIRKTLFNTYNITDVDKSFDGIYALKFEHKQSGYSFIIINTYLPPENSIWGRDATRFYSHVLSIIYTMQDVNAIYMIGDVNSCIGNMNDYIEGIDDIRERSIIDHVKTNMVKL